VCDPRDALDVDLDQATHQLLVHLVEVARVRIRQPVMALDGVLSASTLATSPSRSLPEARASRRRRRVKVSEGTKGVCRGGTGGRGGRGRRRRRPKWRDARMVCVWRESGGGEKHGMCGAWPMMTRRGRRHRWPNGSCVAIRPEARPI
jgi:hypothetical protein